MGAVIIVCRTYNFLVMAKSRAVVQLFIVT